MKSIFRNFFTRKKRILVISGSTGGGHVKAGSALEKCIQKEFPQHEVVHLDVIDSMSKVFKKMYADSYISIVNNFPKLFGYLYSTSDHDQKDKSKYILYKARYFFEEFFALKLKRTIKKIGPEYIIFTHFLPAEHLNKTAIKHKYAKKYGVVVTDFDIHWLWVQKNMDFFFVATDEAAYKLEMKGISRDKIHVTGIPVEPEFTVPQSKVASRKSIGVDIEKRTILLMSGAYGVGDLSELVNELFKSTNKDFQLIVLSGKNLKMYKDIVKLRKKYPGRITAVKFTNEVYKYMAASDFVITKTGGLTSSECLCMGLPIISMTPIPGQEERNLNILTERGVALKAVDLPSLSFRVNQLLENNDLLKEMQDKAKQYGKPEAAANIVRTMVCSDEEQILLNK